jgi:hypothetical protein
MIRSQIQHVLSELDSQFGSGNGGLYGEDIWMSMDEVSEIVFTTNENVYPDNTIQVKFDSASELVLLRFGYYENDSFVATKDPASALTYEQMMGFMLTKITAGKSPYKYPSSV